MGIPTFPELQFWFFLGAKKDLGIPTCPGLPFLVFPERIPEAGFVSKALLKFLKAKQTKTPKVALPGAQIPKKTWSRWIFTHGSFPRKSKSLPKGFFFFFPVGSVHSPRIFRGFCLPQGKKIQFSGISMEFQAFLLEFLAFWVEKFGFSKQFFLD